MIVHRWQMLHTFSLLCLLLGCNQSHESTTSTIAIVKKHQAAINKSEMTDSEHSARHPLGFQITTPRCVQRSQANESLRCPCQRQTKARERASLNQQADLERSLSPTHECMHPQRCELPHWISDSSASSCKRRYKARSSSPKSEGITTTTSTSTVQNR